MALLRILGVVLALAVAGLALGALRVVRYLENPSASGTGRVVMRVEKGTTLRPVLRELQERGAIEHADWLYYYARATGRTELRAGEYVIDAGDTPREILAMLVQGRLKMESFTIAPGLNRWQVRDLLAEQGWVQPEEFDRLCDDPALLREHSIPGPSCEGYLFPETYTFARGVRGREIFSALFRDYARAFERVNASGQGPLDLGERQLVTLASIVEKETGAPEERPHIACVFYNRLRAEPPWKLQTDPTVIYAALLEDPTFAGNLTRKHLRELDNPYNTYRHVGLPPGPIANPGRAALEAVVHPATCNDFFFVSKNNGRHVFCETLECHNRAVQKWQVQYFNR